MIIRLIFEKFFEHFKFGLGFHSLWLCCPNNFNHNKAFLFKQNQFEICHYRDKYRNFWLEGDGETCGGGVCNNHKRQKKYTKMGPIL